MFKCTIEIDQSKMNPHDLSKSIDLVGKLKSLTGVSFAQQGIPINIASKVPTQNEIERVLKHLKNITLNGKGD